MLRYLTAGESHGKAILVILDGYPSGVRIDIAKINKELARRKAGYGRGGRMQIEEDEVEVLSGIKDNLTFGAPIALLIRNKDYTIDKLPSIYMPRPGHADLAGGMKYDLKDFRLVLERASARETSARVAVGSLCKQFLEKFNIKVFSHVVQIGNVRINKCPNLERIPSLAEGSELRCVDKETEKKMKNLIDEAKDRGDSLGGVFEVIALGVPPGLGSYVQWDKRIDALIGFSLLSIPAVKAIEIGEGIENASRFGSEVHDQIYYRKERGFYRKTNRAGGIEGGITNGMPIVIRGYMKPISTLAKPLDSVDIRNKRKVKAFKERADVCAVPSAGVIGEAALAYILTRCILEKFGGDNLKDIKASYKAYIQRLKRF